MIALLSGKPIVEDDEIILDVNGVGYSVLASGVTLAACQNKDRITLYIHTFVREDALELYGFLTKADKKLFLLLLEVSGVGPKTALNITQNGSDQIITAVQQADISFFSSVPRVGKKLSQKIIIDLTSKLGSLKEINLTPLDPEQQIITQALTTLGFPENRSAEVVRGLDLEKMEIEDAIKTAINLLSPK